jgi:cobalt-zinc-cadmium efflux system outer membrane protein
VFHRLLWLCFLASLLLQAACVHYQAHPIDPVEAQKEYRDRTLNTPALSQFVRQENREENLSWPPKTLDLTTLTLVAYFFHPDLEIARTRVEAADAAVVTARQRINPSVSGNGGYSHNPESAATYAGSPTFTIETAGKRGYRVLQAERLADSARLDFMQTAWSVRSRVRAALVSLIFARCRVDLLNTELQSRSEAVEILSKRLAVGDSSKPELDVVQAERAVTEVSLRAAEGEAASILAVLASAVGVPASALENIPIKDSSFEHPPTEHDLPLLTVQRAGLLNRADVRSTLSEYAAADASLRLAIAKQYPDIQLSPAYAFQEGFADYTLGIGLSMLPILQQNQGPIAEAEAQRKQVEAQFRSIQAQTIGQMEQALRSYRGALNEWNTANEQFLRVQVARESAARAQMTAGEGDRLNLNAAHLLTLAAQQTSMDALQRAETVLGSLEDAVQHPLDGTEFALPKTPSPRPAGRQ